MAVRVVNFPCLLGNSSYISVLVGTHSELASTDGRTFPGGVARIGFCKIYESGNELSPNVSFVSPDGRAKFSATKQSGYSRFSVNFSFDNADFIGIGYNTVDNQNYAVPFFFFYETDTDRYFIKQGDYRYSTPASATSHVSAVFDINIASAYLSSGSYDARRDGWCRSALINPLLGHTIDFHTNGGTAVESLVGQTNLPDPLPTTTRDGFSFTGWYTDSSLIFPAIPGAGISEDTTLYAGWRTNQFTVTFEANGGEPVSQLTNVNHLPDPLPITLKVGNDFAGWFTDSEFLHPAVPGAFISQNTTLYAKWIEQQSTDIHVPTVSTPSLLQTGFVTMWQPTLDEVRQLANFLWTTNLFDNLRKLFNDPMEAILFLGIIPFDVSTAERGNIYFGNLDTDVESTPIVQQYYTLDFGDIDMTEYYHSFLDYEPSTTVEIFLPFCGTHKLSANEIMGSVMNLKYNVDVFTGTCVAMLTITKPGIDSVMYSFEGNVMSTIPVTAKNYSDFIRSAVSAVASAIALGAII